MMSRSNSIAPHYSRDRRSPTPKNASVSRVMRGNKRRNTKPELQLRQLLWSEGVRGYRVDYRIAPGRPDIAFVSKRLAVFVNGCFWHYCPQCNPKLPSHNTDFWLSKFKANQSRDARKIEELHQHGWKTIVVWECQLKESPEKIVLNIVSELRLPSRSLS